MRTLFTEFHQFIGTPVYMSPEQAGKSALDVDTLGGQPAVKLTDAHAAIDLGGIAKGHGVDLAVQALREHGIEDALVNVGGDLYAMGTSEDGDAWRIGIRDPEDPAGLCARIDVRDEAAMEIKLAQEDYVPQVARYLDAVESPAYEFTQADPQSGGGSRRLEQVVVLGSLAALVAIDFANTE